MPYVEPGDKICIHYMEGEPLYTGVTGIVRLIDDAGQLHGSWGGLAVIPGTDEFEVIETAQEREGNY